jgi:Yip1 domain
VHRGVPSGRSESTPGATELASVLWAPARTVSLHQHSRFGRPLVIVWLILAIARSCNGFIGRDILEQQYIQRVSDISARIGVVMPQAALEAGRSRVVAANALHAVWSVPARIFAMALLCTLGIRVLGVKMSLSDIVLLCTFAAVPFIVAEFVNTVQLGLLDVQDINSLGGLSLSPARLWTDRQWPEWVHLVAEQCSVEQLWSLAIIAIGLRVHLGLKRVHVTSFVVGLWLLLLMPRLVMW